MTVNNSHELILGARSPSAAFWLFFAISQCQSNYPGFQKFSRYDKKLVILRDSLVYSQVLVSSSTIAKIFRPLKALRYGEPSRRWLAYVHFNRAEPRKLPLKGKCKPSKGCEGHMPSIETSPRFYLCCTQSILASRRSPILPAVYLLSPFDGVIARSIDSKPS